MVVTCCCFVVTYSSRSRLVRASHTLYSPYSRRVAESARRKSRTASTRRPRDGHAPCVQVHPAQATFQATEEAAMQACGVPQVVSHIVQLPLSLQDQRHVRRDDEDVERVFGVEVRYGGAADVVDLCDGLPQGTGQHLALPLEENRPLRRVGDDLHATAGVLPIHALGGHPATVPTPATRCGYDAIAPAPVRAPEHRPSAVAAEPARLGENRAEPTVCAGCHTAGRGVPHGRQTSHSGTATNTTQRFAPSRLSSCCRTHHQMTVIWFEAGGRGDGRRGAVFVQLTNDRAAGAVRLLRAHNAPVRDRSPDGRSCRSRGSCCCTAAAAVAGPRSRGDTLPARSLRARSGLSVPCCWVRSPGRPWCWSSRS